MTAIANPVTLITPDIDFKVEMQGLKSTLNSVPLPEHRVTMRIDTNGTETPLGVVSPMYKVIDHRGAITDFNNALTGAGIGVLSLSHGVYLNGARIYSEFTLDQEHDINVDGEIKKARPFLSFTTSHDGSLKLGFMLGAHISGMKFYLSNRVYSASVKHLNGVKVEKVLEEVHAALNCFVKEIIPLWKGMVQTKITLKDAEEMMERAVKRNVISERRAKSIPLGGHANFWDLYKDVVTCASAPSKRENGGEGALRRNAQANEFFLNELRRLAAS
jgi:hypothetical protein